MRLVSHWLNCQENNLWQRIIKIEEIGQLLFLPLWLVKLTCLCLRGCCCSEVLLITQQLCPAAALSYRGQHRHQVGEREGHRIKAQLCGQEAPSLLRWNVAVADFKDFLLLAWTSSPYRPGPAPCPLHRNNDIERKKSKTNHSSSVKHLEIFKIKN